MSVSIVEVSDGFCLRRADVNDKEEHARLVALDERNFPPADRFEDWRGYEVWWIRCRDYDVGAVAALAGFGPRASFDEDWERRGALWVTSIAVDEPYRRKGYAARALGEILRIALRRGFLCVVSNFRLDNDASRRLHYKVGFEPEAILPGYYCGPSEATEKVWF